jgi:chemotaxis protein methyltransferase CheR
MSAIDNSPGAASAMAASAQLKSSDFARFSKLVYEACGIELSDSKKLMVESRLRKRLRETGAGSFSEYWELLSADTNGEEMVRFIDAMTTNKTDFFRESRHFDYLVNTVIPEVIVQVRSEGRELRVWSAGCSTGKEPYTLAMVLSECKQEGRIEEFSILGTDISSSVLQEARRAVYPDSDLTDIPASFRQRYVLRSRDRKNKTCRMAPEIRACVRFDSLNFMDEKYPYGRGAFDVILCRNVMIYFDRTTKEAVVRRIGECLRPGGYFFIGHSETLNGIETEMVPVAPTVYRKKETRHGKEA